MVDYKTRSKKSVAIGLSGGVDSSVAALLLKQKGHDVTGVFMQCWDEKADGCRAEEDKSFSVQVASVLDIKFVHLDYKKQYKSKVIKYFYDEYKAGRTPNPDVMCNKEIKFGLFYDWAKKEGFDFISTGHYARIKKDKNTYKLLKGKDKTKDQSYFLYLLDQDQLKRIIFPVGDLTKKEVREIAKKANLPTYNRPDSMGICFIGEVDIKDFLSKKLPVKKGKVKFVDGQKIGEHAGAWFFTIGQRHGFKIDKYFGEPLYVISKDVEKNELVVGYKKDAKKSKFSLKNIHWISNDPLKKKKEIKCEVRIRHLGKLHKSKVTKGKNKILISLENPAFGVAPGQSAVIYEKDEVLGGGVIE